MFSAIMKIIPRLETADLEKLEKSLNSRFKKIAKGFGKGLVAALTGGGVVGAGLAFLDKILNPLKEVQESIQKTLETADNVTAQAGQFNTTPGNLFRLQTFAQAKGIDAASLTELMVKFQGAVAEAKKKPGELTAVSNFTDKQDQAEAFFEFIQALQKLDKTRQVLVQQEVFGEKKIGKMSEFLQTDFKFLSTQIGGPSAQQLTMSLEKLGTLEDMQSILRARRSIKDIETKSNLIGPKTISDISKGEQADLDRENKRLGSFDDLKKISLATDKLVKMFEDGYLKYSPILAQYLPMILNQIGEGVKAASVSRAARGMVGDKGKDK